VSVVSLLIVLPLAKTPASCMSPLTQKKLLWMPADPTYVSFKELLASLASQGATKAYSVQVFSFVRC